MNWMINISEKCLLLINDEWYNANGNYYVRVIIIIIIQLVE